MAEKKAVVAASTKDVNKGGEASHKSGSPSKKEAVRLAIMRLGLAASQKTVQDFIFSEYGLKITTNHIGASKTTLRKAGAFKGMRKTRRMVTAKIAGAIRPSSLPTKSEAVGETPATKPIKGSGILMDDILAVRTLVDRIGIDRLHTLVDAFGK